MLKKLVLISSLFLSLIFVTAAFALPIDFDYQIYTVGDKFETTEKSVFGWDEKPWLYIKLPDIGYEFDKTKSFWWDPKGVNDVSHKNKSNIIKREDSDNEMWLSFKDITWFNKLREVGEWEIKANSKLFFPSNPYIDNITINGLARCTVNPEPVSSVLFLLGGGALAIAGRFRRKKA